MLKLSHGLIYHRGLLYTVGLVTLVTTGVLGTTGFLGAVGTCPILSLPLCSRSAAPYNWLLQHLFAPSYVSVCFLIWTFLMHKCPVEPPLGLDDRNADY